MAVYLVGSVMSGVIFALASLIYLDGGIWSFLMWYMVGCWAGFALAFTAIAVSLFRRGPDAGDLNPEFG